MRKRNKVIVSLLAVCAFLISASLPCAAEVSSAEDAVSRAYREDLLVSYIEYWETDGSGKENYHVHGQQYRAFTFLNGYTYTKSVESMPITSEYPPGTTLVQKVTVHYSFY